MLLQAQMTAANEHGTDDTASTFKILEDGSDSLAKEEAGQLASRQKNSSSNWKMQWFVLKIKHTVFVV